MKTRRSLIQTLLWLPAALVGDQAQRWLPRRLESEVPVVTRELFEDTLRDALRLGVSADALKQATKRGAKDWLDREGHSAYWCRPDGNVGVDLRVLWDGVLDSAFRSVRAEVRRRTGVLVPREVSSGNIAA